MTTTTTTSNTRAARTAAVAKRVPASKRMAPSAAGPAPVAQAATKRVPRVVAAPAEVPKRKQPKLVRDSFTIPKAEYLVLDALKQRAIALGHPAKKSELLRAGIAALAAMSDKAYLAKLAAVPSLKTGRPKSVVHGID